MKLTKATKNSGSKSFSFGKLNFGTARAYLFEYGLLLVLTIVLVNLLGMMFQELVGKQASFIQNGFFLPFFSYGYGDLTVGILSTFLIIFPALFILTHRTAAAETVDPNIKNLAWRKGILNIFLGISSLWAMVALVSILTATLNYLNLNGVTEVGFDWREAAENGFKALLLLLAVWAFSSDYRKTGSGLRSKVMHSYRYTIVGVSIIAGVLFAIFPFMQNRHQVVDSQISNDLYAIQGEVNSKYYQNYQLPENISELNLADKLKERATKHNYVYEKLSSDKYKICATFLTKSDGQPGIFPATGVDMAIYPGIGGDFYNHPKGEKCYEQSVDNFGKPLPFTEPGIPIDSLEKSSEPEVIDDSSERFL